MNLFELFASINLDSSQYEAGLDSAEKTTQSFGSKLKGGLQTAGKVAAGAVTAVSAGAAAMTGAFVKGASDLAVYGDNIDKMSQKMGISADAYQEWDAVLQHSGTSMESMSRAMITLQKKAEEDAKAFEALGISQEQLSGMSTEELFAATIEGLQNMEEGAGRTVIASDLLGQGVKELGALLNTSAADTNAMRKRVRELGGVLSGDVVKSAAGFQDSLQDMQTAFGGIKNSVVSDMLPSLTSLMDGFTSLIVGEEGAEEALQTGFSGIMENISGGMETLSTIGQAVLPAITTAIIENLPMLAESVIGMMQFFGETMIENLPLIIESALTILQSIGAGIVNNLPLVLDSVAQAISQVATLLTNPSTLTTFMTTVMTIISTIATSVMKNLPTLINTALQVIRNLITFVTQNLPMFVKMAAEIIVTIAEGLIQALPQLLEQAPIIIDQLITALLAMMPEIVDAGVMLLTSLITNLPQIITTIVKNLPEIISAIVGGIISAVPQLISAGGQLIEGLWQGISNVGEWLREKISGFFGGVVSSIKNFFGIKSPSKVFAGIGEMLDRGLAKGVGDYADLAVDAAEDMANDVFDATDRNFDFTATGNAAGAAGRGIVINVYGAEGQDVEELAEVISQKIAFGYAQEQAVFA